MTTWTQIYYWNRRRGYTHEEAKSIADWKVLIGKAAG